MTEAGGPPNELAETPDLQGAYPRLDDGQIAALAALGSRRAVRSGQILFREGDRDYDFHVVLDGKVAVVRPAARRTSASSVCTAMAASSANWACWPAKPRSTRPSWCRRAKR